MQPSSSSGSWSRRPHAASAASSKPISACGCVRAGSRGVEYMDKQGDGDCEWHRSRLCSVQQGQDGDVQRRGVRGEEGSWPRQTKAASAASSEPTSDCAGRIFARVEVSAKDLIIAHFITYQRLLQSLMQGTPGRGLPTHACSAHGTCLHHPAVVHGGVVVVELPADGARDAGHQFCRELSVVHVCRGAGRGCKQRGLQTHRLPHSPARCFARCCQRDALPCNRPMLPLTSSP